MGGDGGMGSSWRDGRLETQPAASMRRPAESKQYMRKGQTLAVVSGRTASAILVF